MKNLLLSILAVGVIVLFSVLMEKSMQTGNPLGEPYILSILDEHTILFTSEETGKTFKMSIEDSSCFEENSRIFIKR